MKVEETMTREVKVCAPSDVLNRAAQLMWENDCGCVPVVEGDSNVVGMLTDRDICMAAYTQGEALNAMQVSSAMAHEVFACRPSDDLLSAEQIMRQHHVHRLPVVSADGKLVGVISLNDIARGADGPAAKSEVADTLAAVCTPRSQAPIEPQTRRIQAGASRQR
jgi:CBS domain-containing protein